MCVSFPRYNSNHNLCMGLRKWRHESDLSVLDLSVWETNSRWSDVVFEAWEISTCRNPLNQDDGMDLPHAFLNLALRDRT